MLENIKMLLAITDDSQDMKGGRDRQRVTQIDRGDYKIKYEYDSSSNKNLFSDMMGELKPYLKKVRFF